MDEIDLALSRMKEDMCLRGRSTGLQKSYLSDVRKFLRQTGKPLAEVAEEDIRVFLFGLMLKGLTPGTINSYNAAIRFLFEVTLDRPLHKKQIPRMKEDSPLPGVLTKEELERLFACVTPLRSRAMLMTAYGGGLRISEVCSLRICDVDSQRMRLFMLNDKLGTIGVGLAQGINATGQPAWYCVQLFLYDGYAITWVDEMQTR